MHTLTTKRPPATKADFAKCEAILRAAASYYGFPPEQITGHRRTKHLAFARQVTMHLCVERTGLSGADIARYFAHDRGSVAWANRQVKVLIPVYESVRTDIENVIKLIQP